MTTKILVVTKTAGHFLDGLKHMGFDVHYEPEITAEELENCIKNYHAMIIRSKLRITKEILAKAEKLKFIGRLGSGLDVIDLDFIRKNNIDLISSPEGNAVSVAEHAVGTLLSLLHKINESSNEMHQIVFQRTKNMGVEILGKTIGIIGFGNTGSAFATRLQGFGVSILVHDKYKTHFAGSFPYVKETDLNELLNESEVISLHLPLNEETYHYVDEPFLERCKEGVIIVNTSRGQIIETRSLLKAIRTGRVKGACLDVFENEDPGTYDEEEKQLYAELFNSACIICTPHIAGLTIESEDKIAKVLLSKIARYIINEQL